jgi:peptide/nickel transport system ATP-binding protein
MTALTLMRLLPEQGRIVGGSAHLECTDLLALPEARMRDIRGGRMAMIFQEPATSLNPVLTIGRQIVEVLERHVGLRGEAARARATALLDAVGIADSARRLEEYPFQLSGGMKQRVMIALALAAEPELLIADEPTTALDVTIQAQILELIAELQERLGLAVLLITHDLGVVAGLCDRVAVMYGGKLVEIANAADLYARPGHPYSAGLLRSTPRLDLVLPRLVSIEGAPPDLVRPPAGGPYEPRCLLAVDQCRAEMPPLVEHPAGHDTERGRAVACWRAFDDVLT